MKRAMVPQPATSARRSTTAIDASFGQAKNLACALPSVTIMIPTHNRVTHLEKTLLKIVPIIGERTEILVVDDCSSDESIADLCAGYGGRVRYLRTPKNLGVIGARNFGFQTVKTDIVINLDDDSYFEDHALLTSTIELFSGQPSLGVIAFNIVDTAGGDVWPRHLAPFQSRTYRGGGNAWRRSAIEAAGALYPGFWRQGEELEHSMRLYQAGYEVWALPSQIVFHDESPINRNLRHHMSLEAANYLKRIILRVPLTGLPLALLRWIAFVGLHRSELSLLQVFRELRHSGRGLAGAIRQRKPVTSKTYKTVENLRRAEISLLASARGRHV